MDSLVAAWLSVADCCCCAVLCAVSCCQIMLRCAVLSPSFVAASACSIPPMCLLVTGPTLGRNNSCSSSLCVYVCAQIHATQTHSKNTAQVMVQHSLHQIKVPTNGQVALVFKCTMLQCVLVVCSNTYPLLLPIAVYLSVVLHRPHMDRPAA